MNFSLIKLFLLAMAWQCSITPSFSFTVITVLDPDCPQLLAGSISGEQTVCHNGDLDPFTSLSSATGGDGSYTYQWQIKPKGGSWTNISGATSLNYDHGTLIGEASFRRSVASCGMTAYTSLLDVYARPPLNPGSIGSNFSICRNDDTPPINSVVNASGGNGVYSYQWQIKPKSDNWSDIPGATSSTYDHGTLTVDTEFRRTVTSCGQIVSTLIIEVSVSGPSGGGSAGPSVEAYGTSSGTISLTGDYGAIQKWQKKVGAGSWVDVASTSNPLSYSNVTTTTSYRAQSKVATCPAVHSLEAIISIYPEPAIFIEGSESIAPAGRTLLVTDAGANSYQWYLNDDPISGATSYQYEAKRPGMYKVAVRATPTAPVYITENIVVGSQGPTPINYILTTTFLKEGATPETDLYDLNESDLSQSIQYFDGLGRLAQTVSIGVSPGGKDIVQPVVYDAFGREAIKYLPYATESRNGQYVSSTIIDQAEFYHLLPGFEEEDRPYSETVFEASPLNRPERQYEPGDDWYSNNKYVGMEYLINEHGTGSGSAAEKVIAWSINTNGFPVRHATATGYIVAGGYYDSEQLYVNLTKDEDGNAVRAYKNKRGQVVLKKVQVTPAGAGNLNSVTGTTPGWALTYYVYDDFGNLRYVFPPELSKLLHANDTKVPTTTANGELDTWAFQYKYDSRRRMIEKKVPGSGWTVMVYDKRDRLVMTQDAVQKPLNGWLYTKYDRLNRPVITGLYTHGSDISRASMEGLISTTNFFETYTGAGVTHGYSNLIFPTTGTAFTVIYYDNYSFKSLIGGTAYDYSAGDLTGLPTTENLQVLGHVTGSKTNVLGSAAYLWSVNYYDEKYRPVQSIATNAVGGTDLTSSRYDFVKMLETKTTHKKGTSTYTTKRRFEYDHAGRLMEMWHSYNGAQEVLLARNGYNELGQLVTKELHSRDNGITFRQKIDYRYNIRGWLSTINDPSAPEAGDLFSMDVRYNSPTSDGGAPRYSGNISEIIWNTAGAGRQSYGYSYDNMNRLTEALYYNAAHVFKNDRFNEIIKNTNGTPGYDLNGNILRVVRNGDRPSIAPNPQATIDELVYSYVGNQLKVVNDSKPDNVDESGFKELVEKTFNTGNSDAQNEYAYDKNGNMTKDDNKGITAITYNHLNLPVQVNKGPTNYIVYTYDATGRKLKQQVFGTTPKTTEYSGEYTYEDDVLKFVSHEEGRILPAGEYQYFLKDHLGNTRLSFSEGTTSTPYLATMEREPGSVETSENAMFQNMVTSKKVAFHPHSQTYSYRLSGSPGEVIGPARSLVVNTGDAVDMEVYARYNAATTTNSSVGTFLTAIVGAFSLNPGGGSGIDGSQAYDAFQNEFAAGAWIAPGDYEDEAAPKAFLNYLLFDNDFVLVDAGFDQVTEAGSAGHDYLALYLKVDQPGYLYIYLSNENAKIQDVYFDDFKIVHHTNIEQSDDYYPFGLTFNSYSRENSVPNKTLFQETELQDELGLNLYDFEWRYYDPAIVRTPTLDPHAEFYPEISPYSFLDNNPVNTLDPTGMDAINLNGGGGMAICPTCPNTPEFKPYIDDPNNTYHYDPTSGNVSILLDEVTVTDDPPPSFASVAIPILMSHPQTSSLITVGSAAGSGVALTVALVFTPVAGAGEGEMEHLERMRAGYGYIAPPKTLPGFPNAQKVKRKAGRARWVNGNGDILEWDSQHGEVEVYDKQGRHKGAADPDTGEIKPDSQVPGRTTPK